MFHTRMAAALLTWLLAILVFAAAKEMFGDVAALIALTLFVVEPNILAHGAVVTTDIGVLSVAILWAFYGFHCQPRSGVDGSSASPNRLEV